MAETLGLVASVVQLAGAGLKLSQALYQYADSVATADRRIKDIAKEIKLTSFVIEELGRIFKQDDTSSLISKGAVETANETLKECSAVFEEIETTLNKSKKGKMGRLMLPFRENKIELLRNHIDKLKSTLQLLMQVLTHAYQIALNKLDREAEARQREEIRQLDEHRKKSTEKYEELLRRISNSDSSTLVDDDEHQQEDGSAMTTWSIGSTINPDSLAECMDHVKALMENLERLQQAMAKKEDSEDHAGHQEAIESYFVARSYLDNVLLGSSKGVAPSRKSGHGAVHMRESKKSLNPSEDYSSSLPEQLAPQYLKEVPQSSQMNLKSIGIRPEPPEPSEPLPIREKTSETATKLYYRPKLRHSEISPSSFQASMSERRDEGKAAVAAYSVSTMPGLGLFRPRQAEQLDEEIEADTETRYESESTEGDNHTLIVEVIPDSDTLRPGRTLCLERWPSSSAHGPKMIPTNDEKDESSQSEPRGKDVVDDLLREWTTMLG